MATTNNSNPKKRIKVPYDIDYVIEVLSALEVDDFVFKERAAIAWTIGYLQRIRDEIE